MLSLFLLAAALTVPPAQEVSEGFVPIEPGIRLHYFKVGTGKDVLVLPMGSWLKDPLVSLARADRTLILYDTRGRGRSDLVPPSRISFANELSDLDAVRRHFGLERMALAGWSHYGMMATVYAIKNPNRVTRVVLITPGEPRSDPYLAEGMATIRSRVDGKAYEAFEARKKAGDFAKDPAAECRAKNEAMRTAFYAIPSASAKMTFDACAFQTEWSANQDPWWDALFSSMVPWDYVKEVRVLPTPRLVIQGEKDFIPMAASREWAEGSANARLLVMKGVGHHPFVEDAPTFLSAVDAFLDGRWPPEAFEVPVSAPSKTTAKLQKEARAAYAAGDKAGFLRITEEIARRRPGDVWVLYNLACGQALNGRTAEAERTLAEIASYRVVMDLDADADFDSIRQSEGYKKAVAAMAALRDERVSSGAAVAFTVREKGLVPEGVAYDSKTKAFFVSSIRKRKIVRVDASGRVSDFVAPAEGGLRSAAGIAVDPKSRTLWVATEAMPHMEGFHKGDPPASAVFEFDLDTGRLRREHRPPAAEPPAAFDDLAVAADGRVYVNDGRSPRIWWLAPGGNLQVFLESDTLRGTQGLAPTPDGSALYVSDYNGLFRVDVATKRVMAIPAPAGVSLNGIDGLVLWGRSLYGIQNGIRPNRVVRLDLAADGVSVSGAKILEMNHPDFDEPTLGVAAEGFLYFTANSQGGRFQDEKHPISEGEMRDAVTLKLPLEPER